MDDVYEIGTFVKIHEMQYVEDKMRLVVLGHRRLVTSLGGAEVMTGK